MRYWLFLSLVVSLDVSLPLVASVPLPMDGGVTEENLVVLDTSEDEVGEPEEEYQDTDTEYNEIQDDIIHSEAALDTYAVAAAVESEEEVEETINTTESIPLPDNVLDSVVDVTPMSDVILFEEPIATVEEENVFDKNTNVSSDSPSEVTESNIDIEDNDMNRIFVDEDETTSEVVSSQMPMEVDSVDKVISDVMANKQEESTQKVRKLVDPDPEKCGKRPQHFSLKGHGYFYSDDEPSFSGMKVDWLEGRNLCREFCMDLVSIETPKENDLIKEVLIKRDVPYIWTSGRLCNFKGCEEREDLQPPSVAGWFWSGSGIRMAPTNSTPPFWPYQPWSYTGHRSQFEERDIPQPDNAEFLINGNTEACMAIFNDIYEDGVSWHDAACYHKKFFLCEDSKQLLEEANVV